MPSSDDTICKGNTINEKGMPPVHQETNKDIDITKEQAGEHAIDSQASNRDNKCGAAR